MLDEIFELFERDKKKRHGRPTGKRSLMDRVSSVLGDNDRRRSDDRYDRRTDDDRPYDDDRRLDDDRDRDERYASSRYDADDRPRYADDRYERRDHDDDDRRRYDDDRNRDAHDRKPSKKKRLMDLLDFD
jgi:hypothetical protein